MPTNFPTSAALPHQVDARFRVLWADHGDEVSRQYAGTVSRSGQTAPEGLAATQ